MSVLFSCALILFLSVAVQEVSSVAAKDDISIGPNDNESNPVAECGMYMAPSDVSGRGRVVIAGKFIRAGQIIDHAVTLTVKHSDIKDTQLNNYVYGTNEEGFSMAELGVSMLYNHHESPGVHNNWDSEVLSKTSDQIFAHTTFTTVASTASKNFEGQRTFHLSLN